MRNLMKKATLALALGASAITAAAPAEAQRYRGGYYGGRHYYHHGDRGGTALVAGIAGLAIGAALTSNNRYDRRYRYDYDYYDRRGYFPSDGYYARNYYNRGWSGWDRCGVSRVYDPYIGRDVLVRSC